MSTAAEQSTDNSMISITDKQKKRISPFAAALLLNAFCAALLFILFVPYFETNDDTLIASMVNGVKIISDPHLVYQNVLLGRIYIFLYKLTDRLPWYTLIQMAVLFASYTAVSWVLIRKNGLLWGCVTATPLVLFFGYESYVIIQYTRTAGIAAASAMVLLFHAAGEQDGYGSADVPAAGDAAREHDGGAAASIESHAAREQDGGAASQNRGHRQLPAIIAGILLGLIASWYRFPQFLPCALLTTGIGLWQILDIAEAATGHRKHGSLNYDTGRHTSSTEARPALSRLLRLFLPFLVLGVLVIGTYAIDRLSYRDGVWKEYMSFNDDRTQLYDYGFPSYDNNAGLYEELGISADTFKLYRNGWNFADPDRFTEEVMEKLIAAKPARKISLQTVKGFLKNFPWRFREERAFYVFAAVFVVWLLSGAFDRKRVISVIYGIALFGLLYFYLYYQGRYLRERVDTGLWYALSLSVLYLRGDGSARLKQLRKLSPVLLPAAVLLILITNGSAYSWRAKNGEKREKQLKRQEQIRQAAEDDGHLYIGKLGSLSVFNAYAPFDRMLPGAQSHLIYLGGWGAYTSAWWETAKAWNVTNPYRDLIGREDIYLLDDDIELTLAYLRSCYDSEAEAVEKGSAGKYKIYSIVSAAP